MKSGLIREDLVMGMATEIKLSKEKKVAGFSQINPFSLEERDAIFRASAADQFCPISSAYKYSFYTPLA